MLVITAAAFLAIATFSTADIVNHEFASWSARGSDEDLLRFITRPDLTPPKLDVSFHNREASAPGYIFVAPYDCLQCGHQPTTTYVTQQIGPHIYAQDGELVWSGIDLFPDRKAFDFRAVLISGEYHLAMVAPRDEDWHTFADGAAIILNASYHPVHTLTSTDLGHKVDLHEFNIIDNGETALMISGVARDIVPEDNVDWRGKLNDNAFVDIDIRTQNKRFHWNASDHIDLSESTMRFPRAGDSFKNWDWLHMNSVDKDEHGNYLVSGRHTDTIYFISKDGSILWRLGGLKSSFTQDFTFSRQHHARIRRNTPTHMTISFFDNAMDDVSDSEPTADSSSLLIVSLDLESMHATVNIRHPRPDGGLSQAKGNVEYLENGNILAGWGENAYMTEYTKPGAELVYEASFASSRFANYRAYKMDFVARPLSKPVIKGFASTDSRGNLGTSIYISWNGATEVVGWRYYAYNTAQGKESVAHIGDSRKTGFETAFLAAGYHPIIFAEAVDVYGNSLSNSSLEITELPLGFHDPAARLIPAATAMRSENSDSTMVTAVAFTAGVVLAIFIFQLQNRRHGLASRLGSASWGYKRHGH